MTCALVISVHFQDDRYHGDDDWPPAPARLFQALVAAAALPGMGDDERHALEWLEERDAPIIAAPTALVGQNLNLFVPNNDMDTPKVGGDLRKIGKIRTATKRIRPRLFDAAVPLLYVWCFDGDDTLAKCVCSVADGLYQLGRGVDMAWADAEVLDDETAVEARLAEYQGVIYRPSEGKNSSDGAVLNCPERGSLGSLIERHKAGARRFRRVQVGRTVKTEFVNAPKPRFHSVAYNSPVTRLLFDMRHATDSGSPFAPWPLKNATALVLKLRDGAVERLKRHYDERTIYKVLIGRDATEADKALRVRIVPLPSIGHAHVDRSIRRVLVEVPPDCPIRADDVTWAFAGLVIASRGINAETGEITAQDYGVEQLVTADSDLMLTHYGMGHEGISSRLWRSVTPLALPTSYRRRIDPAHMKEQARSGNERQNENCNAIHNVMQALRHAGLRHRVANVRVQREPFEAKGERAEAFADGRRFSKHQLWHVEIEFVKAVNGPLLLGNGRYCGLGLMAPVQQVDGVLAFHITDGLVANAEPLQLARALRRAVMARVQCEIGARKRLPVFFTGHEADGSTARSGGHAHLAFVPDLARQRLLVIAPHVIEHREPLKSERGHLELLTRSLVGLGELRTGRAGKLSLELANIDTARDPLFAASASWVLATAYVPTRHAKRNGRDSLYEDILSEVKRRQLPVPQSVENEGASIRVKFKTAVSGPVLIGKSMHFGGGLFVSNIG